MVGLRAAVGLLVGGAVAQEVLGLVLACWCLRLVLGLVLTHCCVGPVPGPSGGQGQALRQLVGSGDLRAAGLLMGGAVALPH